MFTLKSLNVEIETKSELSMGHTAVDFWRVTGKEENVQWAHDVDAERFFGLLTARLGKY